MAKNTHYHVLRDSPTDPMNRFGGGPQEVTWNPSNDIVLDSLALRPVLSYRADPDNEASNLQFKVTMKNDAGATKLTGPPFRFSGGVSRTIFEVLDHNDITKDNMRFIFEVTGGNGSITVSDIIVWFHRQVGD